MGHPKKQRKKYETPPKPYDRVRIEEEKKLKKLFGLRRKKEIWRAQSILRNFRRRARLLQAQPSEQGAQILFDKLNGMGIPVANLEDVLEVTLEAVLARRLQTIVHKKGLANTTKHARQIIVHGHVSVGDRRVVWPSYIVGRDDEEKITVSPAIAAMMIKEEATEEGA